MSQRTHRWGIIGTGCIAEQFAKDMQYVEGGYIQAVTARDLEKSKLFANKYNIKSVEASVSQLLERKDIDHIYIATPHPQHAELSSAALEKGKNVLCEKPFTMNSVEARSVVETARESGNFLMEAMWTRFLPAIQEVRKLISEGNIGSLKTIELSMGYPFKNEEPKRLFNFDLGGGSLLDMGVYCASFPQIFEKELPSIKSELVMGPTGVDLEASWVERYPSGFKVKAASSMRAKLGQNAIISGSQGQVVLPEFWRASSFNLDDQVVEHPFSGMGLHFQVAHFQQCIEQSLDESPIMPHRDSIDVMGKLDLIRQSDTVTFT